MARNRQNVDPIPDQFKSFDELADFWDAHDLADYEDHLREVEYQVATKPTHHFTLALSD